MLRILFALPLAILLSSVVGCAKEPVRGIVKGRVTIGDKPVAGAVVFIENKDTGVGINAPLDADGTYEAKTYKGEGLPPGSYQVAVLPGGVMEPGEEVPLAGMAKSTRPKLTLIIPERYHKTTTSKLSIEVREGNNPPFDFKLEP